MTKHHYDNSDRLSRVTEKDWREALDQLTAYLTWRLRGKTARGAHSEHALGMNAFDYYQEEACVKLITGQWRWQPRFSLGKQLEKIAADLITKQCQKWLREHPMLTEDGSRKDPNAPSFRPMSRNLDLIEYTDDLEQYADIADEQDSIDETYDIVYGLVDDDEELTLFVSAIEHCGTFADLPAYTGWPIKRVYRLMEKLMRRIRAAKNNGLI